jgi:hypothetical protein
MAMISLRRAQMLVRQNQWGDAQTMAERIVKDHADTTFASEAAVRLTSATR